MSECTCGRIMIGSEATEHRNWNPNCAEHGVKSEWYQSPSQLAKRNVQDARTRELQRQAREARKRAVMRVESNEYPEYDSGVAELGGAVGRRATLACRQGQHDLCSDECECRCHERGDQ